MYLLTGQFALASADLTASLAAGSSHRALFRHAWLCFEQGNFVTALADLEQLPASCTEAQELRDTITDNGVSLHAHWDEGEEPPRGTEPESGT